MSYLAKTFFATLSLSQSPTLSHADRRFFKKQARLQAADLIAQGCSPV